MEALLEKVEEMVALNGGRCYKKAQVYRGMVKQIRASVTIWRNIVPKRSKAPSLEGIYVIALYYSQKGEMQMPQHQLLCKTYVENV